MNFPLFYQQLIQIWAKASKRDPTQTSDPACEICKEVLWNNSCIRCGGKSLYNQYFITKGIMCITDIRDCSFEIREEGPDDLGGAS